MTNPKDLVFPGTPAIGSLTKREYFAAHIFTGTNARDEYNLENPEGARAAAAEAVMMADLLIKALNEKPND